jgi:hypothetical protein
MFSIAQFDDEYSKTQLYDKVVDLHTYVQMVGKNKLYLINNTQVPLATKELDFALSKINENINEVDLNNEDDKIKSQLKTIKIFWYKFNEKAAKPQSIKEFTAFYYQMNTFDKLITNLVETMVVQYDMPTKKISNYTELQKFRTLIQKISLSYFANHLGLSKSYLQEYKKNIAEIDIFIKEKSNVFLNDQIAGKYFSNIIMDWNFYRANLLHKTLNTLKTVYILSTSIDYKLGKIKESYIKKLNNTF